MNSIEETADNRLPMRRELMIIIWVRLLKDGKHLFVISECEFNKLVNVNFVNLSLL